MSKKIVAMVTIILALAAGLAIHLGAGCSLISGQSTTETDLDTALLEEVWEIAQKNYVEPDELDTEALIQGAVRGMVNALDDPHSAYLTPGDYELFTSDLAGEFEGIGAYVGYSDGEIVIIAPMPGSPAENAGIRSGDIIMSVDGESTFEWSLMDAVLAVRGPRGTSVSLLVLHEGDTEPVEIEIIRAEIEIPSVYSEMRGDIAYIIITDFTERTGDEFSTVFDEIVEQESAGIILDLRNNMGGSVSAVVEVASQFLDKGVVVSVIYNDGRKTDYSVKSTGETIELPMVVLVNEFSASASEALAGALQDYEVAVIAGTTTYGKGSACNLYRLSDGSGLYISVARWYTPEGRLIEGEGIEPDFELDPEEVDPVEWALDYLENKI